MAEISTIARPYAVAAFNLAKEKKSLTEWSEMLEFLAQVSLDEGMHAFINDSKVSDVVLQPSITALLDNEELLN